MFYLLVTYVERFCLIKSFSKEVFAVLEKDHFDILLFRGEEVDEFTNTCKAKFTFSPFHFFH